MKVNKNEDDDYLEVSSCHECTGLIPAAPSSKEDEEHYAELYPYITKAKNNKVQ